MKLREFKAKLDEAANKDGFRTKKEGGLHLVFRGGSHVGNILEPTLGGDKKKAQKFTAISKLWGKKSTHDSKHAAMDWLKNKHMSTMSIKMTEATVDMKGNQQNNNNIVGGTPYDSLTPNGNSIQDEKRRKLSVMKRNGLKGINQLNTDEITRPVVENFLRLYREAQDKSLVDNSDNNDIVKTKEVKKKDNIFQIKKTLTKQPGDVVTVDPPENNNEVGQDVGTDLHKKKPLTY